MWNSLAHAVTTSVVLWRTGEKEFFLQTPNVGSVSLEALSSLVALGIISSFHLAVLLLFAFFPLRAEFKCWEAGVLGVDYVGEEVDSSCHT